MTVQTIRCASRGDTDLVVCRMRVKERRFGADLAAATVRIALIQVDPKTLVPLSSGVPTWLSPTTDTVLNLTVREVGLRVGPLGALNPAAGTYVPDLQVVVNNLQMSVDSEHPDTVVIS